MTRFISFSLLNFFKRYLVIADFLIYFTLSFIISAATANIASKSNISSLLHVCYFDILAPYFCGSFLVFFLVLFLFKSKGWDLILNAKPLTRVNIAFAKVLVFLVAIIIFSLFTFITTIIAGNVDKHYSSYNNFIHALSIAIGSLVVSLAFGSIIILIAQIFNVIVYTVLSTTIICFMPAFSIVLSFVGPTNSTSEKISNVRILENNNQNNNQKDLGLFFAPSGLKNQKYQSVAPIDIFNHWRMLYGSLQPINIKNAFESIDNEVLLSVKAFESPQIIVPPTDAIILSAMENNNIKKYAYLIPPANNYEDNKSQVNDELINIMAGNSLISSKDYQQLIRAVFESDQLSIIDKLILVQNFDELGNFQDFTFNLSSKPLNYNYALAKENLKNTYGIDYDEQSHQVKNFNNSFLNDPQKNNNKIEAFRVLNKIILADPKVGISKSASIKNNYFDGVFDISKPVGPICEFGPWLPIAGVFAFWILFPVSLLGASILIYRFKDVRE